MAPSSSTGLSYEQADCSHPCWQYPHGTNSHDAQAPVGEAVGSRVGWAVGALLGALVVLGALLVLGDADGALLGPGVGVSGRQADGYRPALPLSHPFRSVASTRSTGYSYWQED